MRIRKIFFIAVFFPACTIAQVNLPTGQAGKMSLKQCIETALANNIQTKQAGLQVDAAEINVKQAKANLLPNVNGSYGYGFNQGRNVDPLTNSYINQQLTSSNVGLSSNAVLFNGMRLKNLIQQNNFTYEANKMDLQQAKDNLTLNVILAYLQVLSNDDVLVIAKAQAEVTKKQIERMQILVKEGAAANYQLADLKGQLANEEISIINSANALQQSKLSLCQLMNIEYNSELHLEKKDGELPVEKYPTSTAELYQISLQNFSLIKANDFKIKSAEKAIKINKAGFYPTISLNVNLGSNFSSLAKTLSPTTITQEQTDAYVIVSGSKTPVLVQQQNYNASKTGFIKQLNNNLGTFVGINLQIPIFNNFQTKNRIKLAENNLKVTKIESENAKFLLKQNMEQAYLNMSASFDKYKVLMEQVKNFEESFRAAEVRFSNGVINSADYLINKNNLDRTTINFAQSKYDYNFRVKLLDYYKGTK
jgi:outer membrane protein